MFKRRPQDWKCWEDVIRDGEGSDLKARDVDFEV